MTAEDIKLKRAQDRQALLDKLVPDRRCPMCGEVKVASRSWVVRKKKAKCRSCAWRWK